MTNFHFQTIKEQNVNRTTADLQHMTSSVTVTDQVPVTERNDLGGSDSDEDSLIRRIPLK